MMPSAFRIFEVVLYAVINLFPYLFLSLYLFSGNLRFSLMKTGLLISLLMVFQIGLATLATIYASEYTGLVSMLGMLIYAGFYFLAVKEHPGKILFVLLIVSNLANLVVMGAKSLEGIWFPELAVQHNRWSFSLTSVLMHLILLVPCFLFFKTQLKEMLLIQVQNPVWRYLWLIPATFFLIWFYGLYFTVRPAIEVALRPGNTLFFIFINAGAMLTYHIIAQTVRSFSHNMELRTKLHRYTIVNLQFENLREKMEETRRARHDLRHHLVVLRTYAEEKEYDKLNAYLDKQLEFSHAQTPIVYCGHFTLNAVIGYCAQLAEEREIEFSADVNVPEDVPVDDSDLTVLFGNLLENAADGCMTAEPGTRFIRLRISILNRKSLVFTLDNSFVGDLQREADSFRSTKHDGFGVGLESVQNIVNRYNGTIEFETENNTFSVSGVLNLRD